MSKSTQAAAKSIIIMMIFTLGSKLLGFFREMLIAAKFGSGMETDTFFIALTVTGLVTGFIGNAISTTFIPILSEIDSREGKKYKIEHTNNIVNVIFIVSILLVLVGWLCSPIIIKLLAKGFQGNQFNLTVKLTRIGLPMLLFSGFIGVFTGYLQSEQRFTSTAAVGFPFNFVYIFFLLFLTNKYGIEGLMVTSVVAMASQVLILVPEIRCTGYKYNFRFNFKDRYIKQIISLSLPVFIGVAINDLNTIVDKTLASSLIEGSISALNYANKLIGLILGVFISAITTVIFPMLAKELNGTNYDSMKKIMAYGINLILLITIPAMIGLIILSTPIVEIAFQRGVFDINATIMTSQALIFYSLGLVSMALNLLITRVYYSLQDTKTPMINGAISVVLNVILNIILVKFMEHSGLALATSLATTISTILLFYGLKKKIGSLGTKAYITTLIRSGIASGIMGAISYVAYNQIYAILGVSKLYNLISLMIAVGLGIIVYGVLCYIFKVEEVRDIVNKIKTRLIKR